jgi:hypothetical protein
VFHYLIESSDIKMIQQLDKNDFSDKDLVEVKMALNSPYITNTKGYERYDGSVDLNGVHYNYVKRKIYDDTLYLMCICNKQKMQLCDAKNNFQRLVTDVPSNKKGNESDVKKFNITDEYNFASKNELNCDPTLLKQNKPFFTAALSTRPTQTNDQPPEISA